MRAVEGHDVDAGGSWAPAAAFSTPMFGADGRTISVPHAESSDRDAIWILDAATGQGRPAVRFQEPFRIFFRADRVDRGQAFIVNRLETASHILLFDRLR
jgi:hypothetical protein